MATSQIATNMAAVRTHNIFSRNNTSMDSALQRVSTGLKINSAKDGAAQYAISEKMRERINSNQQVSQNVQNDSALAKTASSGLDNTLSILKTMKARALDSANDSNTDDDRKIMQNEITQLISQIDDNATNVKYNGKVLLNGEYSTGVVSSSKTILFSSELDSMALTKTLKTGNYLTNDNATGKVTMSWSANGKYVEEEINTYTSATKLSDIVGDIIAKASGAFTSETATENTALDSGEKDENGDAVIPKLSGTVMIAGSAGAAGNFSDLTFTISPNNPANGVSRTFNFSVLQVGKDAKAGGDLNFQIGEESGMSVKLTIDDMSSKGLSINNLNVATQASAKAAVGTIDAAIKTVLDQQTSIGAMESRLGYVSDNLDTINENLQAADSALRDSDMAKEISDFMKYSVLSQASQYMLAQSHQNAYQLLNLLQ